jgi:hypothetical protein
MYQECCHGNTLSTAICLHYNAKQNHNIKLCNKFLENEAKFILGGANE